MSHREKGIWYGTHMGTATFVSPRDKEGHKICCYRPTIGGFSGQHKRGKKPGSQELRPCRLSIRWGQEVDEEKRRWTPSRGVIRWQIYSQSWNKSSFAFSLNFQGSPWAQRREDFSLCSVETSCFLILLNLSHIRWHGESKRSYETILR